MCDFSFYFECSYARDSTEDTLMIVKESNSDRSVEIRQAPMTTCTEYYSKLLELAEEMERKIEHSKEHLKDD